jgi:hypothetical protein
LGKTAQTNGQLHVYTTNGSTPTVVIDGDGLVVRDKIGTIKGA